MSSILQLENISKAYDGKVAVHDLSLDVPAGSIYGIIGPNGAGKTTTIRMIMNIISPDSGRILYEGKKIDETFKDIVGYLPEERGLYKKLTIREVITYMARLKGYRPATLKDEIEYWLERVDLTDYIDKKVEELSKGMQQKLQFVTTIFHKPQLIILDEIFSGLDPLNMELIKNILYDVRKNGATILFSTHVMEQAEKMCDYIMMIRAGEKILDGRLGDVKSQFGANTAQIVISSGDQAQIKSHAAVSSVVEFPGYIEATIKPGANHMDLLRDLCATATVSRFELMEPSLYSIFIEVAKVEPESAEGLEVEESANV